MKQVILGLSVILASACGGSSSTTNNSRVIDAYQRFETASSGGNDNSANNIVIGRSNQSSFAGSPAGLFSAIISGWINGATGSDPVTREVTT